MIKTLCIWLKLCSALTGGAYAIDGDTIVVSGYHIRLAGIDAEELNEPHGYAAKSAMQTMVQGQQITCKLNGETSYNRYVGTCFVHDLDVGGELVRQGFALDCRHYSGGKYRSLEPPNARMRLIQKPYC